MLECVRVRDGTPEPNGRRRRAARVLAGVIAAGSMLVAPEAFAGSEVAPESDGEASDEPSEIAPREADGNESTPTAAAAEPGGVEVAPTAQRGSSRGGGRLSQYLQRPVRYGAHFLDHGVLQPAIAGGWPHGYRVELSLGLLDHLTLGVTAHWLPSERRPRVSPIVALAILRGRYYEFGLRHFWSLFPPPRDDVDPTTPSYQRSAQWTLATASFGQAWLTGGLDAGLVRERVDDPGQDPAPDTSNPFVTRWRFGGGLHLRAGTRRWGLTAQVLVPQLYAELRFDVRFGLFEQRSKGGWKPGGMAEDWDRGVPW